MKIKYFGEITKDGKMKIYNMKVFAEDIKKLSGQKIEFTIQKKTKNRSTNQNAYYWGVIVTMLQSIIKEQWGEIYTKQKTHDLLKSNCNFEERIDDETGNVARIVHSTSGNSTIDQEEYHEKCRRFVKEWFNADIPLPNEQIEIF